MGPGRSAAAVTRGVSFSYHAGGKPDTQYRMGPTNPMLKNGPSFAEATEPLVQSTLASLRKEFGEVRCACGLPISRSMCSFVSIDILRCVAGNGAV